MTKMKEVDPFSVYYAKIMCSLGNVYRYVIVFVYRDSQPIGTVSRLSSLTWASLQTRSLSQNYSFLPAQTYQARRIPELNHKIVKRPGPDFIYDCPEIPTLLTTLIQTDKKESYVSEGNVVLNAVEQYNTIFSFKT